MRTATIPVAGLLLLLATSAAGYTGTRDITAPGGAYSSHAWASGGVTACESYSDDLTLSGVSPAYCERSGLGGANFADIGCSADFYPAANPAVFYGNGVPDIATGCLDDIDGSSSCVVGDFNTDCDVKDTFVTGTCSVTPSATIVGSDFSFVCSTDRDDDGRYSNIDETSNDPNGFDDDFVVADGPGTSPTFCFTRDGNSAGGDWDDIQVFIEGRDDVAVNFLGSLQVTLTVSSTNSACTVSAHGHSVYWDTDVTQPPPPSPARGWACAGT